MPAPTIARSSSARNDIYRARTIRAIDRAVATLRAKSINGGYPAYISIDGGTNYGKTFQHPLGAEEIRPAPIGTTSFGQEFLELYRAVGQPNYLEAAKEAALALAWTQNGRGGWWYAADMTGFRADLQGAPRPMDRIALDDYGVTQYTVMFLMDLDNEIDEPWLTETIERGLQAVMDSQFEAGAWPPEWPARPGTRPVYYYGTDWITTASIEVLLKAYEVYGDQRYLDAANRGGGFILDSVLPGPYTAWAEQYDFEMNPTYARPWEQPSMSAVVTNHIVRTLIRLAEVTKRPDYLRVALEAADWLQSVQLDDGLWARNYEIGTGRPVYFDQNGKKYYNWQDIPHDMLPPGSLAREALFGVQLKPHSGWLIPPVLEQVQNIREYGLGVEPPDPMADYVPPLGQMVRVRANKWAKDEPYVLAAERDGGWVKRSSRGRYFEIGQFHNAVTRLLDFLEYDAEYQRRQAAGK